MFQVSVPGPRDLAVIGAGSTIRLTYAPGLNGKITKKLVKAQTFVDSEVLRLCSPLVPYRNGALEGSGTLHTRTGTGVVTYKTPYARRWYYEPANFNGAPQRGNRWFERMKQQSGQTILKGAQKIINGKN